MNNITNEGSIYALQQREHKNLNQPIYKVGLSCGENTNRRLSKYPKDSKIHLIRSVKNCKLAEQNILQQLRNNSDIMYRRDLGSTETFEGDIQKIIRIINNVCDDVNSNLIIESIQSNSAELEKEQFIAEFDKQYEITENEDDYIESTELAEWALHIDLIINTSLSINKLLKAKYGVDTTLKKWFKQKKVIVDADRPKKPRWCYIGIKRTD